MTILDVVEAQIVIDEPGFYDIPDSMYHADPVPAGSLSVSGARKLLPPSCPARFAYDRDHPPIPSREFDLGHAAHLEVLGVGAELVVVEAADWRTKAAKEARADAHAAGRIPVLPHQHEQVQDMAAAVRAHPIAGELLDPARIRPELSLFWVDSDTEVWRRARLDALTRPDADGPPAIVDYKTTTAADLDHISRVLHSYGYAMQGGWYLDGAAAVDLVPDDARFYLVFQETEPPYLVTVVEPDVEALRIGRELNRRAIEIYRDCTEAGVWPAHTPADDIPLVGLPPWVERQHTATEYEEIF